MERNRNALCVQIKKLISNMLNLIKMAYKKSNTLDKLYDKLIEVSDEIHNKNLTKEEVDQLHTKKKDLIQKIRETELLDLLHEAKREGICDRNLEDWIYHILYAYKFLELIRNEYSRYIEFYFIHDLVVSEQKRVTNQIQEKLKTSTS